MRIDELLKYYDLAHTKAANKKDEYPFLQPYYFYIQDRVKSAISNVNTKLSKRFCDSIASQIVNYVYKNFFIYTCTFEYHLAKDYHLLQEEILNENDFLLKMSYNKDWNNYLFKKYPILLHLLLKFSDNIIDYISEIVENTIKDRVILSEKFSVDINELNAINLFKGDLHNGRCVCSLEFKNNVIIYYKPRNADNESFLNNIIEDLNKMGLCVCVGIPNFVNRKQYSWHQHIKNKNNNIFDASLYYNNWGVLQCLFYILGTQDIIPDNVIFCDNIPYLIDCESLVLRPYNFLDGNSLSLYLQKSVLKTGILPDWMFDNAHQRTIISSVFFRFIGDNHHLPCNFGKSYPMSRTNLYDFLSGFTKAYDFISENKKEILGILLDHRINSLCSRVLPHPTMTYSCLLNEQMTPEYLASKKHIDSLLSTLVKEKMYGKHASFLLNSIKHQLLLGNVPYFYSYGNGTCLYSSMQTEICDNFYKYHTNAEWVETKLKSLSYTDYYYQCNIIKETLKFYFDVLKENNANEK